jgi:hypothetical protein
VSDDEDIASRLMHCTDYDCDLLGDAAREIERLRSENLTLRHAVSEQNRQNRLTNITGTKPNGNR